MLSDSPDSLSKTVRNSLNFLWTSDYQIFFPTSKNLPLNGAVFSEFLGTKRHVAASKIHTGREVGKIHVKYNRSYFFRFKVLHVYFFFFFQNFPESRYQIQDFDDNIEIQTNNVFFLQQNKTKKKVITVREKKRAKSFLSYLSKFLLCRVDFFLEQTPRSEVSLGHIFGVFKRL